MSRGVLSEIHQLLGPEPNENADGWVSWFSWFDFARDEKFRKTKIIMILISKAVFWFDIKPNWELWKYNMSRYKNLISEFAKYFLWYFLQLKKKYLLTVFSVYLRNKNCNDADHRQNPRLYHWNEKLSNFDKQFNPWKIIFSTITNV